eukprot:scaffold6095_cov92-Isochrysis_galbana.AAC.2
MEAVHGRRWMRHWKRDGREAIKGATSRFGPGGQRLQLKGEERIHTARDGDGGDNRGLCRAGWTGTLERFLLKIFFVLDGDAGVRGRLRYRRYRFSAYAVCARSSY